MSGRQRPEVSPDAGRPDIPTSISFCGNSIAIKAYDAVVR